MINNVILVGRLAKDPEVKKTPSNLSVCSFTVATDGKGKDEKGEYKTEFVNCVAWKGWADNLGKYCKGDVVSLLGSLQTRSYDTVDGKRYVTEVLVEKVFPMARNNGQMVWEVPTENVTPTTNKYTESDFSNTPSLNISSDDLPFY